MREKVKNFRLTDNNGDVFDLYENLDTNILLVFYPKNNSYVCSKQLKDYSDNMEGFGKLSVKVVGINNAAAEDHSLFCTDKDLRITLLSDPQNVVAKQFSALYPFNILKRKLILINTAAEIVFEKNLSPYSYWDTGEILSYIAKNELF
jgi:thioredoxin-dependent peroxiredoxin